MNQPPAHDSMTLAGLAAANGPWLAVRLHRLSEHTGLTLSQEVVEHAVVSTSQVLGSIMNAEGRPVVNMDAETDPAVVLGREQAKGHRAAGLDMPASLKVQRLLRRAYDDLVRESWVDKDTRARAHEDVERFFERALVGLVGTWTGLAGPAAPVAPPQGEESQKKLLARREDELRRAMEAAQKLTLALRQSRERADGLDAELAQAQARLLELAGPRPEQAELESRLQELGALKAQLAQAQAALQEQEGLKAQLAELKTQAAENLTGLKGRLTKLKEQAAESLTGLKAEYEAAQAQSQAQSQAELQSQAARIRDLEAERSTLGQRLAELEMALAAHGDAEIARIEAQEELERVRKEADRARDKAERARTELQTLQESAKDLRSRAEKQAHAAEAEAETLRQELAQLREDHATLSSEAEAMRMRLTETGSRLAETRHAEDEEVQVGLAKAADALAQAQTRMVELEGELQKEKEQAQARCSALEVERDGFATHMREFEAQGILLAEALRRARTELAGVKSKGDEVSGDLAARLQAAEAQVIRLSEALDQAEKAKVVSDTRRVEAEQRSAEAVARAGEILQEAKAQCQTRLEEMTAAREASARLLSTHLALTPDAVAAVDASGSFLSWNKHFSGLFGLAEAELSAGLQSVTPQLAATLQGSQAFVARLHELMAGPDLAEEGMALATQRGETLVFRSVSLRTPRGVLVRLLNFRDVSVEHDMENLVREIESTTRYELGQSLASFIHLPQELLDDPATTPAQAQKLAVIRDSGYRIVNTVNMAVDIFRMERGLYHLPPGRTLDLAVVARRAVKDLAQQAASQHVDLELLLDKDALPQSAELIGPGDPLLAHGLTVNLLRDALAGAPRQSGVSVALQQAPDCLRLDVTRAGALPQDQAAAYFAKPVGQTDGNGMQRLRYASQLIARSLGGTLTVSSAPATGTTLSLVLPR